MVLNTAFRYCFSVFTAEATAQMVCIILFSIVELSHAETSNKIGLLGGYSFGNGRVMCGGLALMSRNEAPRHEAGGHRPPLEPLDKYLTAISFDLASCSYLSRHCPPRKPNPSFRELLGIPGCRNATNTRTWGR